MCDPRDRYEDPIQGALNELVSAMSSLNMHPDPLPPEPGEVELEGPRYLSQSDGWAKHSYEHMRAVFSLIVEAGQEREGLRMDVFRLREQIANMRKGVLP